IAVMRTRTVTRPDPGGPAASGPSARAASSLGLHPAETVTTRAARAASRARWREQPLFLLAGYPIPTPRLRESQRGASPAGEGGQARGKPQRLTWMVARLLTAVRTMPVPASTPE